MTSDEIAFEQLQELSTLTATTNDMIAVFSNDSIAINRGESLFKQHRDIEHEAILKELSLISHPALLHYAIECCEKLAEDGYNEDLKTNYLKLNDSDSFEFRYYMEYLEKKIPHICCFYKDYRKLYSSSHVNKSHSIISNTTSGISSMKPTSGISSLKTRKRQPDTSMRSSKRKKS